jgi:hypothetical protein
MITGHPIADEVLDLAEAAMGKGENWMVYNDSSYLIEKEDVRFFVTKEDAREFSKDNLSDRDYFKVIQIHSIKDLFEKIPQEFKVSEGNINGLYNKEGNGFTDAIIDHFEKQNSLINLKLNVMNNENLQYLSDNLKYMGFGENLKTDLEKNLKEEKPDFQLHYKAEINKKPFEAVLNFRKSDTTDMYFFNNYHAALQKNNGEKTEQTFYINKGKGVTGKEAFNLLDGRSVHKDLVNKEGEGYKAWIKLDFENKDKHNNSEVKQFHENYGYDLKGTVEKFAITDLKDPEKEKALMQSLQKGNVQSVTIEKDGNSHKMFMEADPQFKKVNLYDSNMKMVAKESVENYQTLGARVSKLVKEEIGNDKKKDLKPALKPEKEALMKKNSNSLLPKKRESTKKGLGIA